MPQRSREPGESFDQHSEILEAIRNDLPGIIHDFISREFTNLKESLNEIEKSIKFISARYDDALKSISSIKEELNGLKKENVSLRNTLKDLQGTVGSLEHDLNKHEQWARLQNVEILGIPENKNECLPELVQNIAIKSGMTLGEGELEFVHRIQPRKSSSGKPRPIVVRFKSRQKKDAFLSSMRKRKNSTSDLGIPGQSKIFYVNEHLTQRNKKLLFLCKTRAKEFNYLFVWTKNCRIYVRKNETSPHILITNSNDLLKII